MLKDDYKKFKTFDALATHLKEHHIPEHGATLFIKGSRGMALERILEYL